MKQCEICLDEFQESRGNRKYCAECGKDPYKSRKHYDRQTYINKKNAGEFEPTPKENTCRMCNKKWLSIYSRTFCSSECLETHIRNNGRCKECNQLLIEKGITTGRGFCSDECRKVSQTRKALAEGSFIPCKVCGKEFISKSYSNIFCSRDCFNKHSETKRQSLVKKEVTQIKKKCKHCNKIFVVDRYKQHQKFCSRECSQNNIKLTAKQKKEETKKQLKVGKDLNICTTCRTSQLDCERFTSNFVYRPIGAMQKEINGKFIIVSCPKFKE